MKISGGVEIKPEGPVANAKLRSGFSLNKKYFCGPLLCQPLRPMQLADGKAPAMLTLMREITFTVEPCRETGGFVARWDDAPGRGGITTQGDSFGGLDAMIADAVNGYFEPARRPTRVRLQFVEDPLVSLA